jgi:hypothetical protein
MKKVLVVLGIAVAALVRKVWKTRPEQRRSHMRDRVTTWENEGGHVLGVPPTRDGR